MTETSTMELRYIKRRSESNNWKQELVLQQKWLVDTVESITLPDNTTFDTVTVRREEWRDIPVDNKIEYDGNTTYLPDELLD